MSEASALVDKGMDQEGANEELTCPLCTMDEVLDAADQHECGICGHRWDKLEPGQERVIKDVNGNVLADGDTVTLIKDLKIDGKSGKLKSGTKIKGIRLIDGDHEIDCKVDGRGMLVRAAYVKRA